MKYLINKEYMPDYNFLNTHMKTLMQLLIGKQSSKKSFLLASWSKKQILDHVIARNFWFVAKNLKN